MKCDKCGADTVVPEERWIPVTERLPEGYGWIPVIVFDTDGVVFCCDYWFEDKEFWPANGKGEHWAEKEFKVTHWMPLPQKPSTMNVESP